MDGLTLYCLIQEWQQFIGSRIDKVHQPAKRDLVLTVRGSHGTSRLLLSAHRRYFRAHQLTKKRPANPMDPPMFCVLARKHLEGGRIVKIRQQDLDRAMEILVQSRNDVGDVVSFVLVVELMGKHSNVILCEAGPDGTPQRVVDSIVRVTAEMSRVRPILPGTVYSRPPKQDKVQIEELAKTALTELDWSETSDRLAKKLPRYVTGIGPITAQEALHRARERLASLKEKSDSRSSNNTPINAVDTNNNPAFPEAFIAALQSLHQDLLTGKRTPMIGLDAAGHFLAASPFELTFCSQKFAYTTYDSALEEFYQEQALELQSGILHQELAQQMEQILDRLRAKQTKLRRELERSEDYEEEREKGELLTAYASQVGRGNESITLPNFYDEYRPVTIALNPAKTAIENAQEHFRQAAKRKRAIGLLTDELETVAQDIAYLENCILISKDADRDELDVLREELAEQSFLKPKSVKKKPAQKEKAKIGILTEYTSSDGFPIFVGRNNKQNDWLTFKKSQPEDLWFHVKDQPGSHAVIQTRRQVVPLSTLEEAATAAAYFSKGRDSSKVAVDYTEIRHVWKPNGARPGFALYKEQKTLYVTPNRMVLRKLEENSPQRDSEKSE